MERKITNIIIVIVISVVITMICTEIARYFSFEWGNEVLGVVRVTGGFILAAVLIASGLIFMKLDSINKKLDSITKGNNDKDK